MPAKTIRTYVYSMKTLIIGLGNPILGDDGVGWQIANEVERRSGRVEVDCLAVGGISLMERLVGYDRVILVDSISSGLAPQGTVLSFPLEELPDTATGHLTSAHDTSLQTALRVGRLLGAHLPDQVTVVAIESQGVYDFCDSLSPEVSAAVPGAVRKIFELLNQNGMEG
jgi:hydrogenase maturation protease